jgi:hypothetical protein
MLMVWGLYLKLGCGEKWIVIGCPPLAEDDADGLTNSRFFSNRRLFTCDFAVEDASSALWQYEVLYLAPGTALYVQ